MKIVLQRTKESSVTVDHKIIGKIDKGYLLLVCVEPNDTPKDLEWCAQKIVNLRINEDEQGKMNLNLSQVEGEILSISQFTLGGEIVKGNRPSFGKCENPEVAKEKYLLFNELLRNLGVVVKEGIFGADMKVSLLNDGPVTFIVESNGRE